VPEQRRRYVIGARKIPHEQRDVAHAVMTDEDPRGFADVIDADDDPQVPLGADVAYAVELTDAEADRFRGASNCRYVEPDERNRMAVVDAEPVAGAADAGEQNIPPDSTMRYMGASAELEDTWHGRDVPVAVLDGGTTAAVRTRFAWQLAAHRDFTGSGVGPDGITVEHGCWVSPLAVPPGGQLVQAVVFDAEGYGYNSWIAAAIKWSVDAGARVVNFSGGGGGASQAIVDAARYAATGGAVVVCSAGNSGEPVLEYPARHSETEPNVVSSIAFVEATDTRAGFSNHAATGSGCAPGDRVLTVGADGGLARVSGTSFSAPHMSRLAAMCATGGRYTPLAAAGALVGSARDTPAPPDEEGAGAWHLERALRSLGAFDPTPDPQPEPEPEPEPDPLAGFPFAQLDDWAGRQAWWWARYAREAASAYQTWRSTRIP
jgi:hypothetical protein